MSNIAILVDEQGNFIGHKERNSLAAGDAVAVSGLWVENSQGEVLIAQRSMNKTTSPGLWGPAAAGTLEPGETFESNIIKEAAEEIGLSVSEPEEVYRVHHWRPDKTGRYTAWFRTKVDKPIGSFKLQKEEVAAVKWITKSDLLDQTKTNPQLFVSNPERWQQMLERLSYN